MSEFDRWRTGHSLAFASWLATQGAGSRSLDDFICRTLSLEGEDDGLDRLSSYVLHFVRNMSERLGSQTLFPHDPLSEYATKGFRDRVDGRLSELHAIRKPSRSMRLPSIARAARMVADAILYGIVPSPLAVQRIGWRSLAREEWDFRRTLEDTTQLIAEIRHGSRINDKVGAIETLLERFKDIGISTGLSELAFRLFDGAFVWPLVVLDAPGTNSSDVGFGFPVGISITLDNQGRVDVRGGLRMMLDARELDTAVAQAKALFGRNCSYHRSSEYRNQVAEASVAFDCSYADAFIGSTATEESDAWTVSVRGGSATPCLAVGVFGRFVHSGNLPPVALTAEFKDGEGVRPITTPAMRVSKLEWARVGGRYDRVVVPRDGDSTDIGDYLSGFSSPARIYPPEIVDINSLSVAADAMLPGVRWRRFSFCRTPEIRWALLKRWRDISGGRDGDECEESEGVGRARELLGGCRDSACWIDDGVGAVDVALALDGIDRDGRELRDPLRVAFVGVANEDDGGCVDGNPGERLLGLLGIAVGVPQRYLGDLVVDARSCIQAVMLGGGMGGSFRPPDVIVLVTAIRPEDGGRVAGLVDLVGEVCKREGVGRAPGWADRLGNCRVVVVLDAPRGDAVGGGVDGDECLGKLGVFRYGFTQHMAARVIGGVGVDVRSRLQDYVRQGILRVAGEQYHIAGNGRRHAGRLRERMRFEAHHDAARAFMAPLSNVREPGLVEAEARRIEWVREAEYHCLKVIQGGWDGWRNATNEEKTRWGSYQSESMRNLIYLSCCLDMAACEFLGWAVNATRNQRRYDIFWNEARLDFVCLLEDRIGALKKLGLAVEAVEAESLLVKLLIRSLVRQLAKKGAQEKGEGRVLGLSVGDAKGRVQRHYGRENGGEIEKVGR